MTRIFCIVLALHLLNFSIDSKDPHPEAVPEDLSFNDIESVTEFFAETVLGWKNAFAEHDEKDSEDGGSFDVLKFYFSNCSISINHRINLQATRPSFVLKNSPDMASIAKKVSSPPPEA